MKYVTKQSEVQLSDLFFCKLQVLFLKVGVGGLTAWWDELKDTCIISIFLCNTLLSNPFIFVL